MVKVFWLNSAEKLANIDNAEAISTKYLVICPSFADLVNELGIRPELRQVIGSQVLVVGKIKWTGIFLTLKLQTTEGRVYVKRLPYN